MGFGRKMGAFLGLVPDDVRNSENYDQAYDADYPAEYADDYSSYSDKAPYSGDYAPDYKSAGYADSRPGYENDRGFEPRAGRTHDDDAELRGGHSGKSSRSSHSFAGEPVTQGALAVQPRIEARPVADTTTSNRPVTVKLTGFGEARIIGEKYRDGQAVIMEMTDMADSDARRLVDFAAGLAFARRGSIDKVATKVFMLLPPDVDVSAEERREYAGAYGTR